MSDSDFEDSEPEEEMTDAEFMSITIEDVLNSKPEPEQEQAQEQEPMPVPVPVPVPAPERQLRVLKKIIHTEEATKPVQVQVQVQVPVPVLVEVETEVQAPKRKLPVIRKISSTEEALKLFDEVDKAKQKAKQVEAKNVSDADDDDDDDISRLIKTVKRPPSKAELIPKGFGEVRNMVALPSDTNNAMNAIAGFSKEKRALMKANKQ